MCEDRDIRCQSGGGRRNCNREAKRSTDSTGQDPQANRVPSQQSPESHGPNPSQSPPFPSQILPKSDCLPIHRWPRWPAGLPGGGAEPPPSNFQWSRCCFGVGGGRRWGPGWGFGWENVWTNGRIRGGRQGWFEKWDLLGLSGLSEGDGEGGERFEGWVGGGEE